MLQCRFGSKGQLNGKTSRSDGHCAITSTWTAIYSNQARGEYAKQRSVYISICQGYYHQSDPDVGLTMWSVVLSEVNSHELCCTYVLYQRRTWLGLCLISSISNVCNVPTFAQLWKNHCTGVI